MSASESAYAEKPVQTTCQMKETPHPVFETGADDQPIVQTSQHPEWFSQPRRPPSPDRAWNTTLPAAQGDAQSWISDLARQTDARLSFNELFDTPIDFSNFIMHRLNVDTLTPDILPGPTYELMRGSCTSLTELEYHLEEVYKATTDQLDWVNPEGQQYALTEADKAILDTYGDSTILKRRRDDDDQEGPSAGSNRGSKRQKEEGEQASASTPSEKATEGAGRSTTGSQSRQMSASESAFAEEPMQTTSAQRDAQSWISDLARQTDARSSFNELLETPIDFSNFIMHRLNVDTLTPDLLAGPTYELMKGSCASLTELEYHLEEVYKATTD
nr:hypothetical protein [Tanacetum cinerariifolium]